jgi:hypothetical protein
MYNIEIISNKSYLEALFAGEEEGRLGGQEEERNLQVRTQ